MRKLTEKFIEWCKDPSDAARLERTIVQGVIAIILTGLATGDWGVSTLTAIAIAVFTAIQTAVGKYVPDDDEQILHADQKEE